MVQLNRIKDFILDKKSLSGFCVLLILYNTLVLRLISYDVFYEIGYVYYVAVIAVWAVIQFADDIIRRRLLNTRLKLYCGLFYLMTAVVFVLNRPYSLPGIKNIAYFFVMWYPLMSASLDCTKEEFAAFFRFIAKHVVVIVLIINIISLAAYFLLSLNVVTQLPAVFVLRKSGHASKSLIGWLLKYRYAGLYSFVGETGFYSYLAYGLSQYLYQNKVLKKAGVILVSVTSVMMIILSNSRTAEICAAVLTLYLVISLRSKPSKDEREECSPVRKLVLILLGIGGIAAAAVLALCVFGKADIYTLLNKLSSARLSYWSEGITAFMERKWFGYGWGNIVGLSGKRFHYHNLLVGVLVWTGIAGMIFFLFLTAVIVMRIRQNSREIKKHRADWVTVLVLCIFIESMLDICIAGEFTHIETLFFWIGLGYLYYMNLQTPLKDGSFLIS